MLKKHIKPCNCETCLKAKQDAIDEIVEEIKKIQILADEEQS